MAALLRRRVDLASIARTIRRSPIIVTVRAPRPATRRCDQRDLPAGYELADIVVLDWIAAEALRAGRNYLPL
jgi:hypothetical protein